MSVVERIPENKAAQQRSVCARYISFYFLYHVIFFIIILVPMCAFKAFYVLRFVLNYQHDMCCINCVTVSLVLFSHQAFIVSATSFPHAYNTFNLFLLSAWILLLSCQYVSDLSFSVAILLCDLLFFTICCFLRVRF